ncbi:hypothetical protein B0H11DRAFT_2220048 [Mycena galericulata]|nr:hypothetical protein B0H11DRAFT_2220048 [Mycena galericulata]
MVRTPRVECTRVLKSVTEWTTDGEEREGDASPRTETHAVVDERDSCLTSIRIPNPSGSIAEAGARNWSECPSCASPPKALAMRRDFEGISQPPMIDCGACGVPPAPRRARLNFVVAGERRSVARCERECEACCCIRSRVGSTWIAPRNHNALESHRAEHSTSPASTTKPWHRNAVRAASAGLSVTMVNLASSNQTTHAAATECPYALCRNARARHEGLDFSQWTTLMLTADSSRARRCTDAFAMAYDLGVHSHTIWVLNGRIIRPITFGLIASEMEMLPGEATADSEVDA